MYNEKIDGKDFTYLEQRLKPIGITERLRRFVCNAVGRIGEYWDADKAGNLVIRYPSASGFGFQEYWKKIAAKYEGAEVKDEVPTVIERIRYRAGFEPIGKDQRIRKYHTPAGCPSPLFIPWNLLHRIRSGGRSSVLFVTEGEIKAAAADRHGLPIVAVAGIKNTGKDLYFLQELREVIDALKVERLCFIYDNDLFDLSSKIEPGGDPTSRPRDFMGSAKIFAERAQALGLQAFIAWPAAAEDGRKRGLDDEIIHRIGEAPVLLADLEREADSVDDDMIVTASAQRLAQGLGWNLGNIGLIGLAATTALRQELHWVWEGRRQMRRLEAIARGKQIAEHGWDARRIDNLNDTELKKLWALHSPEAFLDRYREKMADWEFFMFGKRRYNIDGGKPVEDGLELQLKLEQRNGALYSTNSDGVRRRLGHFTMHGQWRLYGAREAYVLNFMHSSGRTEYRMVDGEILASSDRFRVLMLKMGMMWKGNQAELNEIVEECVVTAPAAEVGDVIGWDTEKMRWIWANGIYQAGGLGWLPANDEGAVEIDGHTTILVSSPMFKSEKHLDEERMLAYVGRGHTTWQRWVEQASLVYGQKATVAGMAFVVASTVMDFIRERRRFFPIMFMFGPKGQGKTTFCRSIQSFYGKPLPPRNLESGSTVAGLQRSLQRYSQIPLFLDEASSRTRPELLDLLKQYFDGTGGTQGVKSATNETKSFQARAAVIAASQHLPAHDPALVSRCILVEFPQRTPPTMEQKENMGMLRVLEDFGLQHLIHQVLELRPRIEKLWNMTFMRIYKRIIDHCHASEVPIEDRTAEIHAAMMTPLISVCKDLQTDIDEETIVAAFLEMLPLHAEASAATDEGEAFWTLFQRMRSLGRILDGTHYMIDREAGELAIQFRQCHVAYLIEMRGMDQKGLPEATLRRYLLGSRSFIEPRQKRLRPDASPTWLLFFKLDLLTINLD